MKSILFITGNKRKVWQAQTVLDNYGIEIEVRNLDVPEVQSHDPDEVALAKARSAYDLAKKSLVICDFGWTIPALNGFPGSYMKDMNYWFTTDDFLRLMRGVKDRSINQTETIVYTDGKTTKSFTVTHPAKFTKEPRGIGHNPNERVIVYDGRDKTIAEYIDIGEHARDMEKSAWQDFGKWYSSR